ncbi:MAG TPA: ATP-dependent DNA helicase [Solirubrobacterales bacterium]|nr:ATP-dependent DNA helicase [Solirubrobacterales bacterium]
MLALAEPQERAIRHRSGPLLLVGEAGTGKTEVLGRRFESLVAEGTHPERILVLASTGATAQRLRERVDRLLDRPLEELWIGTWEESGERLLRECATAAGLDPFFGVLGRAERLALLLDRLDQLPLRHQQIRGNPAGLLARVLEQIDELKSGSEPGDPELVELAAAHDRILADACSLDRNDVYLTLGKLLDERRNVRAQIAHRFEYLMVDEYEDTTPAQRTILELLQAENANHVYAQDAPPAGGTAAGDPHSGGAREAGSEHMGEGRRDRTRRPETIVLTHVFRDPPIRFWRCTNERAQAQAVAREAEHLIAQGTAPEGICVLVESEARGGPVAAAMEERGIPFHLSGPAALFQRPEVRDAIAWLRVLADPADSAAAARALTRPPVELRSADLARLTTIARRRKLDMVSACEAALESPQIPPEARERIQSFLKLYGTASAVLEERRADVFVRRLIEAVGLRRQRLFAAQPEVAERLLGLSRLAQLAATWAQQNPNGSTRDFVRHLSAVADARVEPAVVEPPARGAVQGHTREAVKGMEFERVFVLGLESDRGAERIGWPARSGLVLARIERSEAGEARPSELYATALEAAGGEEEAHEEELFGPAEGLHATYRMLREEMLEASWKAGRDLSEPRLDTAIDVNRAIARYLELLKLAALAQRPGDEPTAEAIEAVNGLLRQVATPEQQAELDASSLDSYLLGSEREREGRRRLIGARHEPSLEEFLPRRGDGALSLSASDLDLYLTCPLKYKFARVFGIPQEPTINQRFGILIHNVLERFHKEGETGGEEGLPRLMGLFETGWRRTGFGSSDDELQFRDRAREAMRLYWERESESEGEPVWLERKFDIRIGEHHVRGRVDRVDRLPGGDHELIDYKTGERKSEAALESDLQLSLYRLAAREAWELEANTGSYYYVLDAEKVAAPVQPDDAERVERTVFQVGEGVLGQDFEPRPSPTVCSWCDYRLICPAAES